MARYLIYVIAALVVWSIYHLFAYLIWRYGETGDRIRKPAFTSAIGLLMDFLIFQAALSHLIFNNLDRIDMEASVAGFYNQLVLILFLFVNGFFRARALHKRGQLFASVQS